MSEWVKYTNQNGQSCFVNMNLITAVLPAAPFRHPVKTILLTGIDPRGQVAFSDGPITAEIWAQESPEHFMKIPF